MEGYRVHTRDGQVGHVVDFMIDDRAWSIHHIVVHTGAWLSSRNVVLAPRRALSIDGSHGSINTDMTHEQVENSPHYDSHQPVNREHERQVLKYYESYLKLLG